MFNLRNLRQCPAGGFSFLGGEVLASLARLGYVTSEDGKTFALRRVA
jgi:hypothetical protein